jgi:hypothetical protein
MTRLLVAIFCLATLCGCQATTSSGHQPAVSEGTVIESRVPFHPRATVRWRQDFSGYAQWPQ